MTGLVAQVIRTPVQLSQNNAETLRAELSVCKNSLHASVLDFIHLYMP